MSNRDIVADYLVCKLSEDEINSLAETLKDKSCVITGDLIKINNKDLPLFQVVSIARSGWVDSTISFDGRVKSKYISE